MRELRIVNHKLTEYKKGQSDVSKKGFAEN